MEQIAGSLLILLLQVIVYLGNPVDCHTDPIVDIAIGNALGQFGQFLSSLPLQLLADAAFSDFSRIRWISDAAPVYPVPL